MSSEQRAGWAAVDLQPHNTELQEKAEQDRKALEQDVRRALEQSPLLADYLRKVIFSTSYSPGRAPADVAYCEGSRGLAATLMKLGGQTP